MSNIFITGMSRSGTTFLDSVVNSLPEVSILSQPFPFIFRFAKQKFFESIDYPETYYVLNDYFNDPKISIDELTSYLFQFQINFHEISSLVKEMKKFTGQYSRININNFEGRISLNGILNNILQLNVQTTNLSHYGLKETQCEDFIPYFTHNDWKCIMIIRNPYDVVTSIQYGKGKKYTGHKRPTLFHLRNWRKSANFAILFEEMENFLLIRYEDLVTSFDETLKKIIDFLDFPDKKNLNTDRIKYSMRNLKGNSSFEGNNSSLITKDSLDRYKKHLPQEMIEYINMITEPELKYFRYEYNKNSKFDLNLFQEPFQIESDHFLQGFSNSEDNISLEIKRKELLHKINISETEITNNFISEKVYKKLMNQ